METPPGENITAAEFRIYKEQVNSGETKTENKTYLIKLYQVCSVLSFYERIKGNNAELCEQGL